MIDLTQTPKRLKQSILVEAMQGKLTKQLPTDGNTSDLLVKIANYKRNLVQNGKLKGYSKPLPPVQKDEEPFNIPDNWQWTRLSTITPITLGKTPARHNTSYWNGKIPWVSIADLNDGVVSNTKEGITSKAARKIFHNDITPAGSLLMSFKLTIGKMGILKYPAYHNEAIVSFRFFVHKTNNVILRNYLYYTLPLLTTFVRSTSAIKGNTLNKSKLKKMLIPLPPLSEQKRIVQHLNQILPKIDGLNRDVVRLHYIRKVFPHRLKQSLLMEAMQGKLTKQLPSDGTASELLQKIQQKKQALIKVGKIRRHKKLPPISKDEIPSNFNIPKNWKWVRLQSICDYVQKGKSPKYSNRGFPILNQKCVRWSGINFSYHKDISKEVFSKFSKNRLLKAGDILWNTTGTGTLGRLSIVSSRLINYHPQIVVNGDVLIIRSNKYINSDFILKFLSSPIIQGYLRNIITGSTKQIHLNLSVVLPLLIPLPPLAEQKRIVIITNKLSNINML